MLISTVQPNSPASEAGIWQGDVIEEAGGDVVGSVSELKEAISTAGARHPRRRHD